MSFKQAVYERYLQLINEKINSLQTMLDELNESAKMKPKAQPATNMKRRWLCYKLSRKTQEIN